MNKSGLPLEPRIISSIYSVSSSNETNIRFVIPGYLMNGEYYIKISMYTYTNDENYTSTKNIKYIIKSFDEDTSGDMLYNPIISNIITDEAILIDGAVNGIISISGNNFSDSNSNNSISILDKVSGNEILSELEPFLSEKSIVKFNLPSALGAGIYKVKIIVNDKSYISKDYFTIAEKRPIIDNIEFSDNKNLTYGEISGELNITGWNLWDESGENNYKIINGSNEIVANILNYTADENEISFQIPKSLLDGIYFIQLIVNGKSVISKESIEILVPGYKEPIIDDIDKSNAILKEGDIRGYIIVNGQNLIPNPIVEFIDSNGDSVKGSIIGSTDKLIKVVVPLNIESGDYLVKVSVLDRPYTFNYKLSIDSPDRDTAPEITNYVVQVIDESVQIFSDNDNKITINEDKILDILNSIAYNIENSIVSIVVPSNINNRNIEFKQDVIEKFIDNKVGINLDTGYGNITLPIEWLENYENKPFNLKINKIEEEKIENYIKDKESTKNKRLNGNLIDIEINDSDGKKINEFAENIKVSAKVDASDTDNVKKLCLYYLDENTGEWVLIGGKFDNEKNEIYSYLNHLTKFAVFENNIEFSDVGEKYWANEYIEVLSARNIISGMGNSKFAPEEVVNRAQFVTLLVKALGIKTYGYGNKFDDVNKDDWFREYVEAGEIAGIVSGIGNYKFDPYGEITREQMAVMVMNAYRYIKGKNIEIELKEENFNDYNSISDWAVESVKSAYSIGLIKGMENFNYNPGLSTKRSQAATIIYNLLDKTDSFS